jgi:hypothetical protein
MGQTGRHPLSFTPTQIVVITVVIVRTSAGGECNSRARRKRGMRAGIGVFGR